jgi:threonine/homoserine/homoserine lactone efflux protein
VLLVLTNVAPEVLSALQIIGGIFLLHLAFNAYLTLHTFTTDVKADIKLQYTFFKAVLVNLLNLSPCQAWSLVIGPPLIKGWNKNQANGIVLLTGFYGFMIINSTGMIMVFASARNLGPRISQVAIGISVIAFAVFGFYQLWSGIRDFV